MRESGTDFAELCAYVDGELSADDAARVAEIAARHPTVAAQIAQLSKLKSVMPEAVLDGREPKIDLSSPDRRRSRLRVSSALAASLLLALVAVGVSAVFPADPVPSATAYQAGLDRHRDWSRSIDANPRVADRAIVDQKTFAAPDLSAAQLSLRVSETFAHGSETIQHFGYVGSRGCKLSFFVLFDLPPSPSVVSENGLRQASWAHGNAGFMALANGMEERHFETIVAVLRDYSIDGLPPTPTLVDQLVASRLQARPCFA